MRTFVVSEFHVVIAVAADSLVISIYCLFNVVAYLFAVIESAPQWVSFANIIRTYIRTYVSTYVAQ
jgi:hypothetical protein